MTQATVDYQRAIRLQRAVDIDSLWFAAADKLAVERPMTGDTLLVDHPVAEAMKAAIVLVRRDADQALMAIEQQILTLSYPGAEHQLAIIRAARKDLAALRDRASTMMALPRRERQPGIFHSYVQALGEMLGRLDAALDLGDVAASQQDGQTTDLLALSRQAWTLRRMVGAQAVPLMAALNDRVALGSDQIQAQSRLEGAIQTEWAAVDAFAVRLPDYPELAKSVAAAHIAFREFDALCRSVLASQRDGTPPTMTAMDLAASIEQTAPVVNRIRDVALDAALARVLHNRLAATISLAASASVVLLIMAATLQTIRLLKRRIVSPVLALTEAIDLLARRDYAAAIPARGRVDEIGRMAGALETLRRGAIVAAENDAKLIHLARHDSLTGLANRALLHERIEQAMALAARGQPCAVLCLDLDRFKAVNDTFGHPMGDALLQAVAERLLLCVRDVDTVSRLGGDEFVVLLIALTEVAHSRVVAERITTSLNLPFDLDGQQVTIGVSVGIAVAPQDATLAVELLKNADTALYRAKQEDKGTYRYFKPEMHVKLRARVDLERDLRDALQAGAFELFYQPQYALLPNDPVAAYRLCGFEALLRWRHPARGMISPSEFITVAEETGLIVPIGDWVLRQACLEASGWPDDLRVGVNLSAIQFKTEAVVQSVRQALETAGLTASRLDLEITETALLGNNVATLAMLRDLHDLGVSISMDDFGTGYSSLSYLRSFPFDMIKIDQSFVHDLSEREDARAIVRAVIALGRSLGMKILAEGVETAGQLAHLRQEGCDEVQGYLFSKPLPAGDARLLANQAAAEWPAAAG